MDFQKKLTALVQEHIDTGMVPFITEAFKQECFAKAIGIRYTVSKGSTFKIKIPEDHPEGIEILKTADILKKAIMGEKFVYLQIRLDANGKKVGYAVILHYGLEYGSEQIGGSGRPVRSQQVALRF